MINLDHIKDNLNSWKNSLKTGSVFQPPHLLFSNVKGISPEGLLFLNHKFSRVVKKCLGFLFETDFPHRIKQISLINTIETVKFYKELCGTIERAGFVTDKLSILLQKIDDRVNQPIFIYQCLNSQDQVIDCRLSKYTLVESKKRPQFWIKLSKILAKSPTIVKIKLTDSKQQQDQVLNIRQLATKIHTISFPKLIESSPIEMNPVVRLDACLWRALCLQSSFQIKQDHVHLEKVPYETFLEILSGLLFPERFVITWENLEILLTIAMQLKIPKITKLCLTWLQDQVAQFDVKNEQHIKKATKWFYGLQALENKQKEVENENFVIDKLIGKSMESIEKYFSKVLLCSTQDDSEVTLEMRIKQLADLGVKTVDLHPIQTSPTSLCSKLVRITTLQNLNLGEYPISDQDVISLVSKLTSLDTLFFNNCQKITSTSLFELAKLTSLKKISLYNFPVLSQTGLQNLAKLPHKKLVLWNVDMLKKEFQQIPIQLHSLNLIKCSGPNILKLAQTTSLKKLSLSEYSCRVQGDPVISALTDNSFSKNLKSLFLSKLVLNEKELNLLDQLPALSSLVLKRLEISNINALSKLTLLKVLDIEHCNQIENSHLSALTNLQSLEQLSLAHCEKVTGKGIAFISKLANLVFLNLVGCKLNEETVEVGRLSEMQRLSQMMIDRDQYKYAESFFSKLLETKKIFRFDPKDYTSCLFDASSRGGIQVLEYLRRASGGESGDRVSKYKFFNQVVAEGVNKGKTPLLLAIENHQVETVRFLLKNKADPFICNPEVLLAFNWAIKHENLNIIRTFLELGVPINGLDDKGRTALHFAARNLKVTALSCLLQNGADVNIQATGEYLVTPLHEAVQAGDFLVVSLLVESQKLNVNIVDDFNHSPLWYAVTMGRADMAKLIVEHASWKHPSNLEDPNHINQLLKIKPVQNGEEMRKALLTLKRELLKTR